MRSLCRRRLSLQAVVIEELVKSNIAVHGAISGFDVIKRRGSVTIDCDAVYYSGVDNGAVNNRTVLPNQSKQIWDIKSYSFSLKPYLGSSV